MSRRRTIAEEAVHQLLAAYRKGFFPMADLHTGEIHWHNPETRGLIPLTPPTPSARPGRFHVSRTLRQRVRQGRFVITADKAFAATIMGCADPDRDGAWIDETIIRTYRLLHDAGHAHSIEAWLPDTEAPIDIPVEAASERSEEADAPPRAPNAGPSMRLVGGLYGVSIGGAFFGESMFSRPDWGGSDASKVCLVHLVAHLRRRGYTLLDAQMFSWHLDQFGCEEVMREAFLPMLEKTCRKKTTWGEFTPLATDGDEEPPAGEGTGKAQKRLSGE